MNLAHANKRLEILAVNFAPKNHSLAAWEFERQRAYLKEFAASILTDAAFLRDVSEAVLSATSANPEKANTPVLKISDPAVTRSAAEANWFGCGECDVLFSCHAVNKQPTECIRGVTQQKTDAVIEAVRSDLLQRSQVGLKKYGIGLDRTDLGLRDWLQHAYEETLDQANYLKRSIMALDNGEKLK